MIEQGVIDAITSALCEESGEVARAIIKRNHARRGEGDRKGYEAQEDHWDANLRRELAQVVIVAAKIANREGFNLGAAVEEEILVLDARARVAGVWP